MEDKLSAQLTKVPSFLKAKALKMKLKHTHTHWLMSNSFLIVTINSVP